MDATQFGKFISERRKELGMTQAALAETLHVTDKAVSRWERGIGFPDIGNLEALASALEISLAELMQNRLDENESINKKVVDRILIDTISISKEQNKLFRISAAAFLSVLGVAAAAVICILMSDFRLLMLPAGSLLAGLIAWGLPVWHTVISKSDKHTKATIISFSFALLSVLIQFISISRRVHSGDFGGIEDIIDAEIIVIAVFSFVTVLINALMGILNQKHKH